MSWESTFIDILVLFYYDKMEKHKQMVYYHSHVLERCVNEI